MILLDIYVEKKGSTHWSKRARLCWDGFGNSYIPTHVHVWNQSPDTMRGVTVRRETQYNTDEYRLQVVGEGDSVSHCNWVRRCGVDTAIHLA